MAKARSTGHEIAGGSVSVIGVGAGASVSTFTTDRDVIKALVTFLEDRRALYRPRNLEVESHVALSVLEIHKELTEAVQQLSPESLAAEPARRMRAACRKYLEVSNGSHPHALVALGELRAMFGAEVQRLDTLFKLHVEAQLRELFPVEDIP